MNTRALLLTLATLLAACPPAPCQWTNDPWNGMVPVCTAAGDQWHPFIIPSGTQGFYIIFWPDDRNINQPQSHYQILNPQGIDLLQPNGVPILAGANWYFGVSFAIPDGEGGAIAILSDERNGAINVYGQRFDSLGNRLWGATGLPLVVWSGPEEVQLKDAEPDGFGGVFVCYGIYDFPDTDIYMQRINSMGQPLWGTIGVPIHVDPNVTSAEDRIVQDGSGGAIDVWQKYTGFTPYLWAQHFDANGNPLWGANGIQLFYPQSGLPISVNHLDDVTPDGSGGGIWSYDTFWNWYLFRLSGNGQMQWLYPFTLPDTCYVGAPLRHPNDGSIWLSTSEKRPGQSWSEYLYRFDLEGNPLFGAQGLPYGGILTPTADGVIALRAFSGAHADYLRAQRVDSTGAVAWNTHVNYFRGSITGQVYANFLGVPDGSDGLICAWEDRRDWDYDIYAQRVQADGTLGNPLPPPPYAPTYPEYNLSMTGKTARFTLPLTGVIQLQLYDLLGRKLATLVNGNFRAGAHEVTLDQEALPSGIYLLKLTAGAEALTVKVVITK